MKIGDYVRTKYGITQFKEYEITNGEKLLCMPVKDGSQGIFANIEDVVKSSPRIIDLIKVGDYVNGLKVQEVNNEIKGFGTIVFDKDNSIMEDYIYSIVTKEMYSSVEYRVENN